MGRLVASIVMLLAVFAAGPASAERQLAIGAAGGVVLPEGTRMIPVYTWPRGTRWEPVDAGEGYRFREPIYTTPRGYRYVYVRGYRIIKARKAAIRAVSHKRHVAKHSVVRVKKARKPGCVTDLGYGRYELCL
jgi:hypothetical protein